MLTSTDTDHQKFRVFIRKARQAAHQALFFLYELAFIERLPTHDSLRRSLESDVAFARTQVTVILDSAWVLDAPVGTPAVPPANPTPSRLWAFFADCNRSPRELFALANQLDADDATHRKLAEDKTVAFWRDHVRGQLHAGHADWTATNLVDQLRAFLQITHPHGVDRLSRAVDKIWIMARRNLSFLVGLTAAIVAFVSVEQLRSLLLNNARGYLALAAVGGGALIIEVLRYSPSAGLRAGGVLLPAIIGSRIQALLRRHTHAVDLMSVRLRIGKRAFYQWASHALAPERGIERWPVASRMREVIGRWEIIRTLVLAGYLIVAYFVGIGFADASAETYRTLFPIATLFLIGLLVLHWVDLWDFLDWRPIRILGLGLFLVFLVGSLVLDAYLPFAIGVPLCLLGVWARQAVRNRKATLAGCLAALCCVGVAGSAFWGWRTREQGVWRADGPLAFDRVKADSFPFGGADGPPVVLVAASGGGSRAAVYTALTLDAIQNEEPELRQIARNLHAISSVSGGSLAAAAYIAERIRRNELDQQHAPEATPWGTSTFVRRNFLNPTLEGAVRPGKSRGVAIEEFWDDQVHLNGRTLRDLADLWRAKEKAAHGAAAGDQNDTAPPFPLPLFNSCALDSHAVVISPLAFGAYSADDHVKRAQRFSDLKAAYGFRNMAQLTWVVDRDAIYGLDEWNAKVNPTMAQAVRASANFPFGFPLVDVDTADEYGLPFQKNSRRIMLTDGGVLSNSGLWSLYHLMTTDAQIVQKLKARGVLLIVIDASKMPEYKPHGSFTTLFGAIRDQAPLAQNLHRKMFELLNQRFGARLRIVGIDLPPTVYDNVQTTWALDSRSLKRLDCNFSALWKGSTATKDAGCVKILGALPPNEKGDVLKAAFREKLLKAWRGLKASAPLTAEDTSMLRVPLD